ncbi:MAG: hypothetical protein AAFO91_02565, partial [Bacteroidota bacterium]
AYQFLLFYNSHEIFQVSVAALMRLSDVVGSEVMAIALGYSVAMLVQATLLLVAFAYSFSIDMKGLLAHIVRCFSAAAFGAISAYVTLNFLVSGINPDTFVGISLQGVLAGLVGVAGVIIAYAGLNTPELREIYASAEKRLFRTDVVAPQKDII